MSTTWPTVSLGELIRLERRPVDVIADHQYQEIGTYSYGRGIFHKTPRSGLEVGNKDLYMMKDGDVILQVTFAWEGAIALCSKAEDGLFGSVRYPTFRVNDERCFAPFLVKYLTTREGLEQIGRICPGSAGRNRVLALKRLSEVMVPLPPRGEQCRIVAHIEKLAAKLEEANNLRIHATEELAALRQANITACMKSLNADAHLSDVLIAAPRNGWSPTCDNLESGTPVLTLSAVTGWNYIPSAFKRTSQPTNPTAHYWAVEGDLLITRSNTPELVGHAAICNGLPNPCIYPDLIMRLPVDPQKASTRFVWYWLQSTRARDFIRRSAKGTSPTMKKISQSIVQQVPFPANLMLDVQEDIVRRIDGLQARTNAVAGIQTETSGELNAILPAILDKAFKGEL